MRSHGKELNGELQEPTSVTVPISLATASKSNDQYYQIVDHIRPQQLNKTLLIIAEIR
jgi:hypothetical protein